MPRQPANKRPLSVNLGPELGALRVSAVKPGSSQSRSCDGPEGPGTASRSGRNKRFPGKRLPITWKNCAWTPRVIIRARAKVASGVVSQNCRSFNLAPQNGRALAHVTRLTHITHAAHVTDAAHVTRVTYVAHVTHVTHSPPYVTHAARAAHLTHPHHSYQAQPSTRFRRHASRITVHESRITNHAPLPTL